MVKKGSFGDWAAGYEKRAVSNISMKKKNLKKEPSRLFFVL